MRDFTIKIKNFEPVNKLLKYQISNQNDLYLFPAIHPTSQLSSAGLHVSLHNSGVSHLRLRVPIKCMRVGPQITLPFSKTQFLQDIAIKKQSLFTPMDLSDQTNGGYIAILKMESMLRNFLSSPYMTNLRENREFIDYYNLVLTNPYRPTSDFKEFYPYRNLEIDVNMVETSIETYETENLHRSVIELKNCGKFNGVDMAILMPYDESFVIITSVDFVGIRIDLDDIEGTINRLPGGAIIFPVMKRLIPFFR
jgi:hypothetical protein